jgi:hypothetical protein
MSPEDASVYKLALALGRVEERLVSLTESVGRLEDAAKERRRFEIKTAIGIVASVLATFIATKLGVK